MLRLREGDDARLGRRALHARQNRGGWAEHLQCPVSENQNPVGGVHERRVVADGDHRRAPRLQVCDGGEQGGFTGHVEIGVGLIEDDDARIAEERTGERDPLPLAAGQRGAAVTDLRVISVA